MPITSGNYVTPAWQDNAAPPINDDELNAMSETLVGSQILVGSGAPTSATAGKVGQRYADTSTTPATIYKCVSASGSTYVWTPEADHNINTAQAYSTGSSYAAGDYCIRDGRLWRALEATGGTWDGTKWEQARYADDISGHIFNSSNPHGVTATQTGAMSSAVIATVQASATATRNYDAGDYFFYEGQLYVLNEAVAQGGNLFSVGVSEPAVLGNDVTALKQTSGTIALSTTWAGDDPYSQTVALSEATVTAKSKVDLNPTAAQLDTLATDGVISLQIENNNGTLTAWAVGAEPSAAMTISCSIEETA